MPFKGFSKYRVIDFSKLLPGPYATQMLADMGCKVTRVELPYFADLSRKIPPLIDGVGSLYWMVNQGKRELSFDFRKPAGLKRLQNLLKKADVLVEGFRPGLMERIGLGYKEVRKLNRRLVYCSISGYDPKGPLGRAAGHDINFQAMSGAGVCSAQVADLAGSMAAVTGILAALLEGKGRHIQVSITDALHSWQAIPLGHLAATGEDPGLKSQWWTGAHPFYRLYDTQDGGKLAVGAMEKGFSLSLLELLGLSALKGLADDALKNEDVLSKALAEAFRSAPLSEWERRLEGKDVCVTPVRTLSQSAAARLVLTAGSRRSKAGTPPASTRTRGRPTVR